MMAMGQGKTGMSDAAEWARVDAALDELLSLPSAQRGEALLRLSGGDEALRARLEQLLAQGETVDGLLDHPAVAAYQPEAPPHGSLAPGTRLGPWRIVVLLGRGGMGEVYRAERADGQFEQQVAIKLIRRDAAGEPRRFTAERQILARLEHPGIARLLDGGVSGDGRPYMVMELVQGGAFTQWCNSRNLDLEQRLRLFMAVCEAVAYAHRNLVIHRDLKPGNVMVTAEGAVKLLDFGIAKLLKSEPPADAEHTRHVPMTLGYAAPEQAAGGAVTTAVDVYALGMLLFELLTGRRPWNLDELSVPAALDKLLREAPPPPSRFAAGTGAPPLPPRLLQGDLDAIVAKALRKEPEKRYATVDALREDVARVLSGEAVAAREGARWYALGRLVRRNRLLVAAAALLLLAIVGGSLAVAWQAHRAEIEARKATAVKDFIVGIFNANGRDNPDGTKARATTAEQLLDLGARRIGGEMRDVPEVRAELLGTIGGLYADLKLSERAIPLLQQQVDTLRQASRKQDEAQLAAAEVALGGAQVETGRYEAAEATLRGALTVLDRLHDTDSMTRARAFGWHSHVAHNTRPVDDPAAEQFARESLTILETAHPREPLRLAELIELGRIHYRRMDPAGAESYFQQALALLQTPGFGARQSDLADVRTEYAEILRGTARYREAEAELRQSVAIYDRTGPDDVLAIRARQDLGALLFQQGRLAEARPLMLTALQSFERVRGADDLEWAMDSRIYFARLLFARGEFEEAERLLQQCVSILDPGRIYFPLARRIQGEVFSAQGRWPEAGQALADARKGLAKYYGERHEVYAKTLLDEAGLKFAQGELEDAAALYQQVASGWPAAAGRFPDSYVYSTLGLATVQLRQGNAGEAVIKASGLLQGFSESSMADSLRMQEAAAQLVLGQALLTRDAASALPHLKRAVALREAMDDPASPWLAQARMAFAQALRKSGNQTDARRLAKLARAALANHRRLGPQFLEPALR